MSFVKKIDLKKWSISLEFKEIITVLTLIYMECVFGTSITQKSQKAKIPRITPFPCKKTFYTIILPEMDRIHKTLWISFQFGSAPITGTDFTIFCKFCPLQVKLRHHILSSIKTHGIWALWHFPAFSKLVTKNIVLGLNPSSLCILMSLSEEEINIKYKIK